MKKITCLILLVVIMSCASDDGSDLFFDEEVTLASDIEGRTVQLDAVIACAAGSENDHDLVNVYAYLEEGASNLKMYKTELPDVNQNDFSLYAAANVNDLPFFGDTLRRFESRLESEQWVIVTYEIDDEIKISSPMRTKNKVQPTYYTDNVSLDQQMEGEPIFNWQPESVENNAIYFEVVSNANGDLLSGTYTFEEQFQYYNLSNVVLNITPETPPDLISGESYQFTVMDVSLDNWVNTIYILPFIAE